MMRSRTDLRWISFFMLAACATSPGNPWGTARLSLEVAPFASSGARTTEDGALKTNLSYAIDIEHLELTLGDARLVITEPGTDLSFDPANPPPGYSLCHNGHCHSDDGRLVDYAEIERELGGNAAGAEVVQPIGTTVSLLTGADDVALGPCACSLPRGVASSIKLGLVTLRIDATIRDASSQARLPEGGVHVELELPLGLDAVFPLEAEIDRGQDVGLALAMRLVAPEHLFDGIDWGSALPVESTAVRDVVREHLAKDALAVDVMRFSP